MPLSSEPVGELDLAAYVDGQLDEWQCARVEAELGANPALAARVFQDLALQHELRLALSGEDTTRHHPLAARLSRQLQRQPFRTRARRMLPIAAAALCIGMIWAGVWPLSVRSLSASVGAPEFVAAGLAARDASTLRFTMRSMPEAPELDAEELRARTGILLPSYDSAWNIIDAQIYPSPYGPGIEVVFDTADLGRVTHFASRPGGLATTAPEAELFEDHAVVWFQRGETAHVLIADRAQADRLGAVAQSLSERLY